MTIQELNRLKYKVQVAESEMHNYHTIATYQAFFTRFADDERMKALIHIWSKEHNGNPYIE